MHFVAGLQHLSDGRPKVVGVMCRNHGRLRFSGGNRSIGAGGPPFSTSFVGPALAEVLGRERHTVIYDDGSAESVDRPHRPAERPTAWTVDAFDRTVEKLIPPPAVARLAYKSRLVLLTSGTAGIPRGAKRTPAAAIESGGVLRRTPWRLEEPLSSPRRCAPRLAFSIASCISHGVHGGHSAQIIS